MNDPHGILNVEGESVRPPPTGLVIGPIRIAGPPEEELVVEQPHVQISAVIEHLDEVIVPVRLPECEIGVWAPLDPGLTLNIFNGPRKS